MSELRDISQIELILDAGPPAAEKDSQRTVTSETLDGKAMTLTTDTSPARMGHDGASYTTLTKTWMDATTGLPYRRMTLSSKDGGPPTPLNEQDFSGWVLNQPIPNARMAWAPPAGAKPYTEPTLLAVGTPAPDFAVVTPDGRTVHLSDYKGKTVVLDFWATWCGPCQASMPHLEHVYQQVKAKNVVVLAVCVWDDKAAYDKWLPVHIGKDYNFPVAFDPAGRGPKSIARNLYKVTGIPTQYVIDKDGKVAASGVGYEGGSDHRLEANLNKQGIDIPVPAKTALAN
jgi:thiol-disulfide isomerase/thioredoxin